MTIVNDERHRRGALTYHLARIGSVGATAIMVSFGPAYAAGDIVRGEDVYQGCEDCHSLDKNDVGPKHRDLVGRKAGAVPDYNYSPALKKSKSRMDRSQSRQMADQSSGTRAWHEDVLQARQSPGSRRCHRISEGARSIMRARPTSDIVAVVNT